VATIRSVRWLATIGVGLWFLSGCGPGSHGEAGAPTVGEFYNAPAASLSRAATERPRAVPSSLVRQGPYRFVGPPIAVWTDFLPSNQDMPARVFVRLNRDLAFNAPSFRLDGVALAANSGGITDARPPHCYEAAANYGLVRKGYYVGRIVTISLRIRATRGQPSGYLSIKVPLRPALKRTSATTPGVDPDRSQQYFDLLGCRSY
jgi:hypothetical protein